MTAKYRCLIILRIAKHLIVFVDFVDGIARIFLSARISTNDFQAWSRTQNIFDVVFQVDMAFD